MGFRENIRFYKRTEKVMNLIKPKTSLLVGSIVIIILSILLVTNVREKRIAVYKYDSVMQKNSALEDTLRDMRNFAYFCNYILITKDTDAYTGILLDDFELSLSCSIYLADHLDYTVACHDVFIKIADLYKDFANDDLKDKAKDMAIQYLKKGASLKDSLCTYALACIYLNGDHVPQDTVLGRMYLEQSIENPKMVDILYKRLKNSDNSYFSEKQGQENNVSQQKDRTESTYWRRNNLKQ